MLLTVEQVLLVPAAAAAITEESGVLAELPLIGGQVMYGMEVHIQVPL